MIHLTRLSPLRTLRAPHKPYHVSNRKQAFSTPRQNSHTKKSASKKPPPPAAHHLRLHTTCDTQCTKPGRPGHPGRRRKSPPARIPLRPPQPRTASAPRSSLHKNTSAYSMHPWGENKITSRRDSHHQSGYRPKTSSRYKKHLDARLRPRYTAPRRFSPPARNHTFPTPDHTATPP